MKEIQKKGLQALKLLERHEYSYDQLADHLCICRRYAQEVIGYLRRRGCRVRQQIIGRVKYFSVAEGESLLPIVLDTKQKMAIEHILRSSDVQLRDAVYNLLELVNIRLNAN